MSMFLFIFLSIYGSWNAYVLWSVGRCLGTPRWWKTAALAAWGGLMIAGPLITRALEHGEMVRTASAAAWVCYVWMAVVFWAGGLFGLIDTWNLGVKLVTLARPGVAAWRLKRPVRLRLVGAVLAVLLICGLAEAWLVPVKTIPLQTARLAPGTQPLRLVQISDVHVSLMRRGWALKQIAAQIEKARPDVLVCTGDLLDGSVSHLNHLSSLLAAAPAPQGKFSVLGNHEWYMGLAPSLEFHRDAGFRVLRGEHVEVMHDGQPVVIAGVDDPSGQHRGRSPYVDERTALKADWTGRPLTILLKHRPEVSQEALDRFDLQLSGHTHAGQLFPFGWLVRLQYKYLSGYYPLGSGGGIYVSPGTGTWGPPLRLLARPEVTLFIISPL